MAYELGGADGRNAGLAGKALMLGVVILKDSKRQRKCSDGSACDAKCEGENYVPHTKPSSQKHPMRNSQAARPLSGGEMFCSLDSFGPSGLVGGLSTVPYEWTCGGGLLGCLMSADGVELVLR